MSSSEIAKYIDKYEVLGEIGRGAMGGVYKALHPQFRKYVAIKEISWELAGEAEVRRRFELEAELLARIPPHPNIVTVRDAFVWLGQMYLVMDYIEGGTLKDLLSDGVSVERGAQLLDQIMSALDAIHRSSIVHMDLKPANILIDREGIPHLSDFGVAECVGREERNRLWGTAKYVAPELIEPSMGRGATPHQADIYSLGIIAYEMLLGERRFGEELTEVYNTRAEDQVVRWIAWHTNLASAPRNLNDIDPKIPRAVANLVERMMAKDVNARYRNVSDAQRDLHVWFASTQDLRGRRGGPPRDDATLPLDQLRGGGSRSPREGPRHPAHSRSEPGFSREPASTGSPVIVSSPPPAARPGARSFPRWGWWATGAVAFAVLLIVLTLQLLFSPPGFTLIVKNAPAGSDVYVDGARVGIPVNDGTIKAFGLVARENRVVVVKCAGCEDFRVPVDGKDGQQMELSAAEMKCTGDLLSEIDYGGRMILIPAGEFPMGDNNHESDERPQHTVPVDAFYIDKYEVTNEQYRNFCAKTGKPYPPTDHPWYSDYFRRPNSPVIGVTWDQANEFAQWAGKSLATEQEWEKAASWDANGKRKRIWPWGDERQAEYAKVEDQVGYPSPVGSFPRGVSAYGVHDMAGNAAEWVSSSYLAYPGNIDASSGRRPYGVGNKVARGGSANSNLEQARTSVRDPELPETKPVEDEVTLFGIRCVISVQEFLRKRQSVK